MHSSVKSPYIIDVQASTNAALVELSKDAWACRIQDSTDSSFYQDAARALRIGSKLFRLSSDFPALTDYSNAEQPLLNKILRRFTAETLGLIDTPQHDKKALDNLFIYWNQGILGTLNAAIFFNIKHLELFTYKDFIANLQKDAHGIFVDVILFHLSLGEPLGKENPTKFRIPGSTSVRFRLTDSGFVLERGSLQCSNQLLSAFYLHDVESFELALTKKKTNTVFKQLMNKLFTDHLPSSMLEAMPIAIEEAVKEELETFEELIKLSSHKKAMEQIHRVLKQLINKLFELNKVDLNLSLLYDIIVFTRKLIADPQDKIANLQFESLRDTLKGAPFQDEHRSEKESLIAALSQLAVVLSPSPFTPRMDNKAVSPPAASPKIENLLTPSDLPIADPFSQSTPNVSSEIVSALRYSQTKHYIIPSGKTTHSATRLDWRTFWLIPACMMMGAGAVGAFVALTILTSGAALPLFAVIGTALGYIGISASVIPAATIGAIFFTSLMTPFCAAIGGLIGYATGKIGSYFLGKNARKESYVPVVPFFSQKSRHANYTSTHHLLIKQQASSSRHLTHSSPFTKETKKHSYSRWPHFCCMFTFAKRKSSLSPATNYGHNTTYEPAPSPTNSPLL